MASNNRIIKWFSVEFLAWLMVTFFAGGVAWNSLASGQQITANKVEKMEVRSTTIETSVQAMAVELKGVITNQENFKEKLGEQKESIDEQRKDIKEILKILRAP